MRDLATSALSKERFDLSRPESKPTDHCVHLGLGTPSCPWMEVSEKVLTRTLRSPERDSVVVRRIGKIVSSYLNCARLIVGFFPGNSQAENVRGRSRRQIFILWSRICRFSYARSA